MDRILGVMQAEGRALLAEGIAERAEDIDVVMVNGSVSRATRADRCAWRNGRADASFCWRDRVGTDPSQARSFLPRLPRRTGFPAASRATKVSHHFADGRGPGMAPGIDMDRHRRAAKPNQRGIERYLVAHLDRPMKDHRIVGNCRAAFSRGQGATLPAAKSIWLISQPPKMSPEGLVSAGMAIVRIVGAPCGSWL